MVSHMLHVSGANVGLPADLEQEPTPFNLDGHWENAAFRKINAAILASLGGAWDYLPAFPDGCRARIS